MDNKLIALVFTCIVDVTFPPYNAWAGSAQGLTVTPTANDTNAPITVHTASGALASVKRLDPALDALLTKDVVIEKLAEGFDWSEGPVWMPGGYLLFSDVPQNTIFKSNARSGVSIFLQPSGYTGTEPRGGGPGSNGLTHDKQGRLIACQQGDRRVAGWENGKFVSVADRFEGKRFNSPNDVVVKSNGDIYFTDPPYGLPENVNDSAKEIPFQGVYRVSAKDGSVTLLTSKVTRPNGLAFSPDEKILYVANSDPSKAIWMASPVNADGTLGTGRVFLDLTDSLDAGVPDGLKVDQRGNLWATGPGGVLIISPRRQTSRHAGNWRGRVELRLGRGRLHAFHHRSQVSLPRAHEGERSGILIREVKWRGEFVAEKAALPAIALRPPGISLVTRSLNVFG